MKSKLTLLMLTSLVLVGCGGGSSGGSPTPQTVSSTTPPPLLPTAYTETTLNLNYSTALWHVDFESLPDGKIYPSDLCKIGFSTYCLQGESLSDNMQRHLPYQKHETVQFLNSKALRIEIDPTGVRDQLQMFFLEHYVDLGANYDELYYSYRVYYPEDFDPGYGFKALGGLMALVDGYRYPTGCGKIEEDGGFSVRSMIRPSSNGDHRDMVTYNYIYHQDNPSTDRCAERIVYFDMWKYRRGLPQGYLVETRVKMNTPGMRNGQIETTINGVRVHLQTNFRFSQSGGYGINRSHFLMHYGGEIDWNPTRKTHIIVDDMAVTLRSVHEK